MKIGIMGGTFNPIHNAHLMIAEFAREEFCLDRVLFITSGNPPHKKEDTMPDAKTRHKMTKIAVEDNPQFFQCDYEVNRAEYSYTAHTLEYFSKKYPEDTFYFIIGGDSLHDFHKWYCPHTIARLCTILVFARAGYQFDIVSVMEKIRKEFGAEIHLIHAPVFGISSSMIRELVAAGKSIRYLLPDSVAEYIHQNGLYK